MSEVITKEIGNWEEFFIPTCSDRIKKAKDRAVRTPEICLERIRAEKYALEKYKDEPMVIQRARILEEYLKQKTIFIMDGELIVGNVTSKIRGSAISGLLYSRFISDELDDPVKDFQVRPYEKHVIHPYEREELKEVLLPFFKGKTIYNHILGKMNDELREKAYPTISSCPHIPNMADCSLEKDHGHQMVNYEKVLYKGLMGIREEAESYLAQFNQPYMHYQTQEKQDFYKAVIITIDAAIAFAKRYSDLAKVMADKEVDPKRKRELENIAEVCDWVPANPARNWWEALQSVFMIQVIMLSESLNFGNSFGRFDQYMYPFYKKIVLDEKTISHDEALELLECFWIKTCEYTVLFGYDVSVVQQGQALSQCLLIGGQTRDGKDACNDVTMLCMEAEEQVGLIQPEIAMRIWEGTPDQYLRKAIELVRIGRGKLKFFSDRKAIQMVGRAYPDMGIEDLRDYAMLGCVEIVLPHITMHNSWEGVCIAPKLLELVMYNGKCAICGKQIGPLTGDPKTFSSIEAVRQAFRKQAFYWMEYNAKGVKLIKEGQSEMLMLPFCSSIVEGPLQKGCDVTKGGTWYTTYGLWIAGVADTADSLAVIDKLIYRDKKITWDQLLDATLANWDGHENLRQRCINKVPKYGNDNDFADDWAAWVMDTWYDCIDWIQTQSTLLPNFGGKYIGASLLGDVNVPFGFSVGALPSGHQYPKPLADTLSPVQGMDRNGPTAVIKSLSKLPMHRFELGITFNQRLSPNLLKTERDLDNFMAFLRTVEELGIYHIQFNVVSTKLLIKAMKEPENYRDLMVRVASYCSYFVELSPEVQLDIISRTEQQHW